MKYLITLNHIQVGLSSAVWEGFSLTLALCFVKTLHSYDLTFLLLYPCLADGSEMYENRMKKQKSYIKRDLLPHLL